MNRAPRTPASFLWFLLACGMSQVFLPQSLVAQEESLRAFNGKAPQTLDEVWGDYDPEAEPMEVQTFREWEEDGIVIRATRYYIGTFKGKKAWMAGLYAFPQGGKNLPAILQSHGGGGSASSHECVNFGRRGYATFSLSWRVEPRYLKQYDLPPEAQTDWGGVTADQVPDARGIQPSGDLNLDPIPSGRNEGYFLRTLAARRGITFLAQQPEVDANQIGMTGHSMGGVITHQTTAMEPVRLKASAPSDGPPIEHLHDRPRNADSLRTLELERRTAVPACYTDRIRVPMLFLNSVNDFHGHAEDVEWIIDHLPSQAYNIARTPHANHWHNAAADAAKYLWFDAHLKGSFDYPAVPTIKLDVKTADGIPVATVTPDSNSKLEVASVDVYYTRDGNNDFYLGYQSRIWHYAKSVKTDAGYEARIPLHDRQAPLWVYADVNYRLPGDNDLYKLPTETDEFVCSTQMPMVDYETLQAANVRFEPFKRTSIVEDFNEGWQKEWSSRRPGVEYASYKLLDPGLEIPERAKLIFGFEGEGLRAVRVSVGDYSGVVPIKSGMNEVELFPFQLVNSKTKSSIVDWRSLLNDRPPIKLILNGKSCRPNKLEFVEVAPEEFHSHRPDRLANAEMIGAELPLTIALAEQAILQKIHGDPVFTATRGKSTPDYETGIVVRPGSELRYFLNRRFKRFQAIAAPYWQASVTYEIWVDGEKQFESDRMIGRSNPVSIDLDVTNKRELKLVVTDGGNGTGGDLAMWAEATLIK